MWGLSSQTSLLKATYQSIIFRDQLWASLCFVTLQFKQPSHQLGEVFHDFLQGWFPDTIPAAKTENWSRVLSSETGPFQRLIPGKATAPYGTRKRTQPQ
jgi:hypothetical protein